MAGKKQPRRVSCRITILNNYLRSALSVAGILPCNTATSLAMLIWAAQHSMGIATPTPGALKAALRAIESGDAFVDPIAMSVSNSSTGKLFF